MAVIAKLGKDDAETEEQPEKERNIVSGESHGIRPVTKQAL